MKAAELRARLSERDFQAMIVDRARFLGWRVHHDRRDDVGIGGDPGFPDLVLARNGRIIFAELKASKGKVTQTQAEWLASLTGTPPPFWKLGYDARAGGGSLMFCVWRPTDWPYIEEVLA